jgi:hypothetical protein
MKKSSILFGGICLICFMIATSAAVFYSNGKFAEQNKNNQARYDDLLLRHDTHDEDNAKIANILIGNEVDEHGFKGMLLSLATQMTNLQTQNNFSKFLSSKEGQKAITTALLKALDEHWKITRPDRKKLRQKKADQRDKHNTELVAGIKEMLAKADKETLQAFKTHLESVDMRHDDFTKNTLKKLLEEAQNEGETTRKHIEKSYKASTKWSLKPPANEVFDN